MSKTIPMSGYYDLLRDILENGNEQEDRTGTGTISVFGRQLRFDLNEGFPLLPGKFTPFNLVAAELLWFLSGSTNNEELRKLNGSDKPTIWEEWSWVSGQLGPIYGKQWRSWDWRSFDDDYAVNWVDQIGVLINGLKTRPSSRRHIVSAWNVANLPDESISPQSNIADGRMALAPCHLLFQMGVHKMTLAQRMSLYHKSMTAKEHRDIEDHLSIYAVDEYMSKLTEWGFPTLALSCHVNIRSSDTFLGLPFNIASYALLTHMVAQVVGMSVGDLVVTLGDAHIYSNHIDQVKELLSRDHTKHALPTLMIKRKITDIDDFKMEDFAVINYQHYPAIRAPVSV